MATEEEFDYDREWKTYNDWLMASLANEKRVDAFCARVIKVIGDNPRWPEPSRWAELVAWEAFQADQDFDMSDEDILIVLDEFS